MDPKSNPPHWQQSQTQPKPSSSLFFSFRRGTNKRRKPRELNTHTSQDHQIPHQCQHLCSMCAPAPLNMARQSHLISAPPSCPIAACCPHSSGEHPQ